MYPPYKCPQKETLLVPPSLVPPSLVPPSLVHPSLVHPPQLDPPPFWTLPPLSSSEA